nr:tetratricopeptide repeat protein [Chloroflexia bacterium]
RLAIFAGGCTLEAAETVCRGPDGIAIASGLEILVGHSLLWREKIDGISRYAMLETIRDFGLEALAASGEAHVVQREHALFFQRLAERAAPELDGPNSVAWFDRLETEQANLRAALRWSFDQEETAIGLGIAVGVFRFWDSRGHIAEGRAWLDRALAAAADIPLSLRSEAYQAAASLAGSQDDAHRSEALHRAALEIQRQLGDAVGIARTLGRLGRIARMRGDAAESERLLHEALTVGREFGDARGVAKVLNDLGMAAAYRGDYDEARPLYEQARQAYQDLGDRSGAAHALNSLADLASRRGDHEEARRLGEEACQVFRQLGDLLGLAATLINLGDAYINLGDLPSALKILDEAVSLGREHGLKRSEAIALFNQANALHTLGRQTEAASRWSQSLALLAGLEDWGLMADALGELAGIATALGQSARGSLLEGVAAQLRQGHPEAASGSPRTIVDDLRAAMRDLTGVDPVAEAPEGVPPEEAIAEALTANLGDAPPAP